MVYGKFRDKVELVYKLATAINNGYSFNFRSVEVQFKKKYFTLLTKLLKSNCILFFTVLNSQTIKIGLKYYNNKPLFKITICSTNANKKYLKMYQLQRVRKFQSFNLQIFSTSFGLFNIDEVLYYHTGGNYLLKFEFLHTKAILR